MNIKDKIIEILKNDKDLLFSTLRNELIGNSYFDYMIVFESIDEGGIQFLEEQYSDFATIFEEQENKMLFKNNEHIVGYYFTFNPTTKEIRFYDDLDKALLNAINHLEEIADYIVKNYHPIFEWYEVMSLIEDEDTEK